MFTTPASDHRVVDSSSTSHIARNSPGFTSLKPIPKGTRFIYLGTTSKADILGIGDYNLKLPSGGILLLKNTVFAPDMRKNLISVSRLESAGFDVNFSNGKVKILLKGKLIQSGNRVEGLYYIEDISDIDAMDSLVAENHSIVRNIAGNDNCSESEEVVNDSTGNLSSQILDINMEETPSTSMPRRSGRNTQTPSYLDDYFVFLGEVHSKVSLEEEPKTYKQAIDCEESGLWLEAMREELNSMERNGVWELIDLPLNRQDI